MRRSASSSTLEGAQPRCNESYTPASLHGSDCVERQTRADQSSVSDLLDLLVNVSKFDGAVVAIRQRNRPVRSARFGGAR